MPGVAVRTAGVTFRNPRGVTARCLSTPRSLAICLEWGDESADISLEGIYYPATLAGEGNVVQQTTLLRDEVTVWLDPANGRGSDAGRWTWRSQDQADLDRNFMRAVRKENGSPVADYYPLHNDGAYAARYLSNANAIIGTPSSCRWIVEETPSVYGATKARQLRGEGRWKSGKWRVVFEAPWSELAALGSSCELTIAVTDGGAGERRTEAALSEGVRLDLGARGPQAGGVRR
ncbi:MAG: hypothetical protein KIS66_14525 [Fimbriimonadaceae bacterium]|nr:hypothetical protein [Fimbriimonadaceae bacterium]